jgi:hypothetical protein
LPLYSYVYDTDYPAVAIEFENRIAAADAVLFVTREYKRSIPGALKNAIDWASRPYGMNAFTRKPSAVIGAATGKIGTAVAQQRLRSILAFCDSPLMNSLEIYVPNARVAVIPSACGLGRRANPTGQTARQAHPGLSCSTPTQKAAVCPLADQRWRPLSQRARDCGAALRCKSLPRPSAIEAHELSAMRVENVSGNRAPLAFRHQDHDDKPSGADVFHVVHQVLVLLDWPSRTNQRSLQAFEYSMFGPRRIEAAQVFCAMEDVDALAIEASTY